ncbi:unnamed protein product [Penicillium salamii]|nr:unnamed protein product [Penicillium salamii]
MLAIVATDKGLSLKDRLKVTIYVEDVAEFVNMFPILEIIFNPTLVLSPYVFLLNILFRIGAFKSLSKNGPVMNYSEKLYCLWILDGLADVSNKLQNIMLQHTSIDTFVQHYSIGIHVDVQTIVQSIPTQKQLIQYTSLINRSINPHRPYRLKDLSCINNIPHVRTLEERKQVWKQVRNAKKHTYKNAQTALQREFGDNLVIDSEWQLSGKVIDEEVLVVLEQTGYITLQHITLINTILTMLDTMIEKEYECRIAAINTVITVCNTEEGAPLRSCVTQKCSADTVDMLLTAPLPKRQNSTPSNKSDDIFSKVIASVYIKSPKKRPTIYFICLNTPKLPQNKHLIIYKNSRSLSRHFINKHIKPFSNDIHYKCSIYREKLESKSMLLNHTERVHRTVSWSSKTALRLT